LSILEVRNISFGYGGLSVLEDVSLSLDAGEKMAIIGPNGAGKTTLLSVLSGQLHVASGEIFLSGQNITKLPTNRLAHLGISRSFQVNSLFFKLNVIDNVLLALKGLESSRFQMFRPLARYKDTVAEAQRLLESVDLWDKRDVPMTDLSHGEQRQIEILLTIASKPKVLLLDEPSAGMTSGEASRLSEMVHSLMKDTAVLFAAHDLDFVIKLSERIVVLYYGRIIADGTPKQIQADKKVQEIYLGTEATVARTD
jgi:branched-chain amino acid transport system ATP-binding protein